LQRLREAAVNTKRELDGLAQAEVSLPFIAADATVKKGGGRRRHYTLPRCLVKSSFIVRDPEPSSWGWRLTGV
jgi:hypothetical protein